MRQVIDVTELYCRRCLEDKYVLQEFSISGALSSTIPLLCRSTPITKIIAITRSGYAARMIDIHRIQQPIPAVSDDEVAVRSLI